MLQKPGENRLRDAHARLASAVRAVYRMPEGADPLDTSVPSRRFKFATPIPIRVV